MNNTSQPTVHDVSIHDRYQLPCRCSYQSGHAENCLWFYWGGNGRFKESLREQAESARDVLNQLLCADVLRRKLGVKVVVGRSIDGTLRGSVIEKEHVPRSNEHHQIRFVSGAGSLFTWWRTIDVFVTSLPATEVKP